MASEFGYFWNEVLCRRQTGMGCPERPERLQALRPDRIFDTSADVQLPKFEARGPDILSLVHDDEYVETVREADEKRLRSLDSGDTRVSQDIFPQALLSASAGCEAIDHILEGRLRRAFCAVRPPGHHANRRRALGYCIFNNVAIAAKYAQKRHGIDRILIVDWDLDPGNGTQEIFWSDGSVFTLSIHQADLFPSAGGVELIGSGAGEGFNRNVPMHPGTNASTYRHIFETVVGQATRLCRPELVIIAAGFDAHHSDPSSKMQLTADDFARLTKKLLEITESHTEGRTLSVLEGGYNIAALHESVRVHCRTLADIKTSAFAVS